MDVTVPPDASQGNDGSFSDVHHVDVTSSDVHSGSDSAGPADSSSPDVIRPGPDGAGPGPDGAGPADSSSPDVTRPGPDGSTVPCPDGVVVDGVCYTEHCQFMNELGWGCTTPGRTCQLFNNVPFCVPVCAGVECAAGQYCDPVFGCVAGSVNCGTVSCPEGEVCQAAKGCVSCGAGGCPVGGEGNSEGDGGAEGDGGHGDGSADGATGVHHGGCGCRTAGTPAQSGSALLAALAGAAVAARRRRRAVSVRCSK
jgi:MYXO-CTERM domain-containing protein